LSYVSCNRRFCSMNTCIDIVLLFFLYSLVGWSIDVLFVSLEKKRLYNWNRFIGPFNPLYGIGALSVLSLHWFLKSITGLSGVWLLLAFVISATLIASILEYLTGIVFVKFFHMQTWDYSDKSFHLNGLICPFVSCAWGFFSLAIVYGLQDIFSLLLLTFPLRVKFTIFFALSIFFIFDFAIVVIDFNDLKRVISVYGDVPIESIFGRLLRHKKVLMRSIRDLEETDFSSSALLKEKVDVYIENLKARWNA